MGKVLLANILPALSRITRAVGYCDEKLHRWSVRKINLNALTWGPSGGDDEDGAGKILFHANKTLNGLFLGVIQEMTMMRDDGSWPNRISLKVVPVDPDDSRIMQRITSGFAKPPVGMFWVVLSSQCTYRIRGEDCLRKHLFWTLAVLRS